MKTAQRAARWIPGCALALMLGIPGVDAAAQEYPTRPIRIIVPYAAGGFPDPISRTLAPHISAVLGQPVLVDNKPGGGGVPAMTDLLRAPPNGYQMLIADAAQWAIQPALRPGVYDPLKDVTPLGMVATAIIFVTVREDSPAKTFQELVAMAKTKPGALSYGTSGIGSLHQLFMETVKAQFGMDVVHVPYKGAVASVSALVAGDIPIVIASTGTMAGHLQAGKVRRLLASTSHRLPSAPDVPATSDVGMPDSFPGDEGFIVHSGTPKPIVDKLTLAIAKAAQAPDFAKLMERLFAAVTYLPPAEMMEKIRADQARYARAIKLAGVKAE